MSDFSALGKMVPGFDFLQGLMKTAGAAVPAMGQWVAPTLNPEELEKRIQELKTVQFWLEQNARMLGVTIQAMEVQRMTLATLKTMNLPLADMSELLKLRVPAADAPAAPSAPAPAPPAPAPSSEEAAPAAPARKKAAAAPAAVGVVDPLQWWGALTQQFTQLATSALKDGGGEATQHLAGAMVKQSIDAAGDSFKKAAELPARLAGKAVKAVRPAAKAAAKKAPRRSPARR